LIEGYIVQDEYKHYFSIQQNEFALQLNQLRNGRQQIITFDKWFGRYSVSYITNSLLPHIQSEPMDCSLWMNPYVSLPEMYQYLKDCEVNLNNMQINDPLLDWYVAKQVSGKGLKQA
jgi:hypothetical protein